MKGYFDHNATTPLHPAAREAWLRASERHWHNPSSLYRDAGLASQQLEAARERLGTLLGADAERIVFTSGATESNNALFASLPQDAVVLISAIEHPSVREAARRRKVIELPVNADGIVEPDVVAKAMATHQPALVSVMAANNESGALQPWQDIASLCRKHEVPFHTDAAQWIGKRDASTLGECDFITGSAHKFGGPKGCGFLVLPEEDSRLGFLRGGPQENGRRAGTENYPAIEAMLVALETRVPSLEENASVQAGLRDAFITSLRTTFGYLRIISESSPRLWNTALMVMPAHDNLKWLTRLSRRGFSISTGSACSSGKEGSSIVVTALGATPEELRRVVRISSGWDTTAEDWQALAAAFAEVHTELNQGGKGALSGL